MQIVPGDDVHMVPDDRHDSNRYKINLSHRFKIIMIYVLSLSSKKNRGPSSLLTLVATNLILFYLYPE